MSAARAQGRFVVVVKLRQRGRFRRAQAGRRWLWLWCGLLLFWRRRRLRSGARQLSVVNHIQNFDRFEDFGHTADVIRMRMSCDEIIELLNVVAFECLDY